MPGTAVIIVTHNSEKVIGRCLDAIASQSMPPGQVVVVDSGSHDEGYLDDVEKNRIVSVLVREKNIGFARANNRGVEHVSDDVEFILGGR